MQDERADEVEFQTKLTSGLFVDGNRLETLLDGGGDVDDSVFRNCQMRQHLLARELRNGQKMCCFFEVFDLAKIILRVLAVLFNILILIEKGDQIIHRNTDWCVTVKPANAGDSIVDIPFEQAAEVNHVRLKTGEKGLAD